MIDDSQPVNVDALTDTLDSSPSFQTFPTRRKRRVAEGTITDYFDRETINGDVYFKCKLKNNDNELCKKTYKGPATTSAA